MSNPYLIHATAQRLADILGQTPLGVPDELLTDDLTASALVMATDRAVEILAEGIGHRAAPTIRALNQTIAPMYPLYEREVMNHASRD